MDRVSAVPIEQACRDFVGYQLIAVNVTDEQSFLSTGMQCPVFEIRVRVPAADPATALRDTKVFTDIGLAGEPPPRHGSASPRHDDY
jgi:hypothetical protein